MNQNLIDELAKPEYASLTDAEAVPVLKTVLGAIDRLAPNEIRNFDAWKKPIIALDEILADETASVELKYEVDIFKRVVTKPPQEGVDIGDEITQYALNEMVDFKGGENNFTQAMRDAVETMARLSGPFVNVTESDVKTARMQGETLPTSTFYNDAEDIDGSLKLVKVTTGDMRALAKFDAPLPADCIVELTLSMADKDGDYQPSNQKQYIRLTKGMTALSVPINQKFKRWVRVSAKANLANVPFILDVTDL